MHRLLFVVLLFLAVPVRAEWLIAETEHFRLHANMPERAIRERAALLEDYRDLLILMTNAGNGGRAPEPKLDVFVVDRMAQAVPFGKVQSNVAGFYTATPGGIAAYADTGELGQAILLHEYAHHFMLGSSAAAYPSWYIEGFAEYFMTAKFTPEVVEFGGFTPVRTNWLVNEGWISMERLLARRFRRTNTASTAMFYAQSWLLTHYLFRVEGQLPKLQAYLAAVATGKDPVDAFRTHIDPDLSGFQARLERYLGSRQLTFSRMKRPAATPASVSVRPAPPGAEHLLLLLNRLQLTERIDPETAVPVVEQALAQAPDSPLAPRIRALLALRTGQSAAAVRSIEVLLAASPDDADLLRWLAEATGSATPEARAKARRLLARAFRANPDDWRVLRAYVRTHDISKGPLSDNDLDVILRARELAPQVAAVTLDAATALVRADRLPEAIAILTPLAANPHGGALTLRAQTLVAALEAADTAAFQRTLEAPEIEEPGSE